MIFVRSDCKKGTEPPPPSSERTINWSGFNWIVKNSTQGTIGPGPNYFSNSTENVWIDNAGELHLRITKRSGKFYCAEVSTKDSVGYGVYTFYVSSRVDNLDKNVVVGLFTWNNKNCTTNANSEIDIEFSRWGDQNNSNVLQYAIQPTNGDVERDRYRRFPMQLNGDYSIHFFNWTPNTVSWSSHHGHTNPPPQSNFIASWYFNKNENIAKKKLIECVSDPIIIPAPETDTKIDLNLWLINPNDPSYDQEVEVIIHRVDYYPALPFEGLVAYYPFNGNANDESGNGNDGIINGQSTFVADRFNIPNKAFSLNNPVRNFSISNNNLINCGHGSSLQMGNAMSISIWFNSKQGNVFGSYLLNKANAYEYAIGWDVQGFFAIIGGDLSNQDLVATSFNPQANTWNNVTVTWQYPGDMKLYVNGMLRNSNQTTHTMFPTNEDLVLGCRAPSGQPSIRHFDGIIDDVRIYNYALSETEIQQLFHEGGW